MALTLEEAAASLGISLPTLRRHVLQHLRTIKVGNARVIPVRELDRYCEREAKRY